ncbi:MAG: FAD-dependent oxidoreductase [Actinomycetota bacterium]|nr:FAD-dependent oxidoreductase [Actinomycetota bacterium]
MSGVFKVVIVGGGVAALEAGLALRDLAGERVDLTMVAPEPDFTYRPMAVREPFAYAPGQRYPLGDIVKDIGAELIVDRFAHVDAAGRVAHTDTGAQIPYDALVLTLGAHAHERYRYALTIDDRRLDDQLHGLIQDVEGGYMHSLAFVMPGQKTWPLPMYELALMTAERAYDTSAELAITVVTPEDTPLAIFGQGASAGVSELLSQAGITVLASAYAEVPQDGQVTIRPGDRQLTFDRVVALPELLGPAVRGLPADEEGFIPIDAYCRVRGVDAVYAAGDATDFAVKHGGIAAQQADVVATSIASLAGAPVEPVAFVPEIHGMLLTGAKPRYLSARITGGRGFSSEISDTPSWSPPGKIAAKYLAPYLSRLAPSEERGT